MHFLLDDNLKSHNATVRAASDPNTRLPVINELFNHKGSLKDAAMTEDMRVQVYEDEMGPDEDEFSNASCSTIDT